MSESTTKREAGRVVKLYLDSRNRDIAAYPNPNRYKVHLLEPLCAVTKITLAGAVMPNVGSFPYVVVATDLYLRGLEFPTAMATVQMSYPAGTLGIVFNNRPNEKFLRYDDERNCSTWFAASPGGIARLQEFEISLLADGPLYPLVPYAPGKYPEWSCLLKIETLIS